MRFEGGFYRSRWVSREHLGGTRRVCSRKKTVLPGGCDSVYEEVNKVRDVGCYYSQTNIIQFVLHVTVGVLTWKTGTHIMLIKKK
jgi:hypothetical protein